MEQLHRIIRIFVTVVLINVFYTLSMRGQNYVRTDTYLDDTGSCYMTEMQYYDGIGRPTLSASNGIGTNGNYTYTLQCYDGRDRISREYLPVAGSSTSSLLSESNIRSMGTDHYDDLFPYKNTSYDVLNRPTNVYGAGKTWFYAGKNVTKNYGTNRAETVRRYRATLSGNSLTWDDEYYPAGSLTMEETIDEDGRRTQVYRDIVDRVVLEKCLDEDSLETYYVYNSLGQLSYVLSPEYQYSGYKEKFAYEYRHDSYGRVEKSELPHCDMEQNYYDSNGRIIYRHEAMGRYWFFFYDTTGRQIMKGICSNFNYHHYNDLSMVNGLDGLFGSGYVYTSPSSLSHGIPVEILYYDDYQFLGKSMFASSSYCSGLTRANPANAAGLQTGYVHRTSSGEYLLTAIYYDEKGRVIDKRETLAGGGIRTTLTTYSFTDKPLTETCTLVKNGITTTVVKTFTYYDTNDQLETTSIAFNGGSSTMVASYDYNDIGRLETLHRGGNAGDVSYEYNLRGWTTHIDGKGFKEWLHYIDGKGAPRYSGDISSQLWQAGNESYRRGYKFTYDSIGRMRNAIYAEGDELNVNENHYSEKVLEYRPSGGIRKIERFGKKSDGHYGKIDNLRMYYNGMQIMKVKEDALPLTYTGAFDFVSNTIPMNDVQYAYNNDGSLRWDANKGVSLIEYDWNGFPSRVQFCNGNVTEYVYAPTGEKMKAVYYTAVPNISVGLDNTLTLNASNTLAVDSVNYVGNFIFENGLLSKYLFAGGYATFANGQPVYHYYTKDHLGNNRAVVNHNGNIEQIVHYYPFGAVYSDVGMNDGMQKYKYNGKELDRMYGLNQYDYGARNYDPLLCRFTQIDPLCEKDYGMNPYAYCGNNPINAIDPDGKRMSPIYNINGDFLGTDDEGLQGVPIVMENKDFWQGMSHMEALSKDKDINSINNDEAFDNFISHYNQLPNRPDYDGYLTLEEANKWYREGNGQPLYTDIKKIDLSRIRSFGEKYVGQVKTFNLLVSSNSLDDGLVYGNITLKRYPNNSVRAYADKYDFDMKSWKNPINWSRNGETIIGKHVAGKGKPFEINIYGSQELKPLYP